MMCVPKKLHIFYVEKLWWKDVHMISSKEKIEENWESRWKVWKCCLIYVFPRLPCFGEIETKFGRKEQVPALSVPLNPIIDYCFIHSWGKSTSKIVILVLSFLTNFGFVFHIIWYPCCLVQFELHYAWHSHRWESYLVALLFVG